MKISATFRTLFICSLLFTTNLIAQIPSYYSPVDFELSPEEIQIQLSLLIEDTHINTLSYSPDVWDALSETDLDPDNSNDVLLMYGYSDSDNVSKTDRTRSKELKCNFSGSCIGYWNREHVYAKSLGTPNLGTTNAGADAHALRACDSQMNQSRNNRVFADGSGDSTIVPSGEFYPGDEWRGDVARMIMYMYLRYPTQCIASNIVGEYDELSNGMPTLFLKWNAQDPPSEVELNRNNFIEADYQGNRNPFIDNPFLATMIWGGLQADNTWGDVLTTGDNAYAVDTLVYPNPSSEFVQYEYDNIVSVKIFNMNSQLVYIDKNLTDNKTYLPTTAGMYLLEICDNKECRNFRVIKN